MITPGSFGPPKQEVVVKKKEVANKNSNAIWEEEEVVEAEEIYDPNDTRPAPKYVHRLRQCLALYAISSLLAQCHDYQYRFETRTPKVKYNVLAVVCPSRFDFYYKQHVGTEDVFLGTTDKTPSSNDCTHLVVKVNAEHGCFQPSAPHSRCCSLPVRARDEKGDAAAARGRDHSSYEKAVPSSAPVSSPSTRLKPWVLCCVCPLSVRAPTRSSSPAAP